MEIRVLFLAVFAIYAIVLVRTAAPDDRRSSRYACAFLALSLYVALGLPWCGLVAILLAVAYATICIRRTDSIVWSPIHIGWFVYVAATAAIPVSFITLGQLGLDSGGYGGAGPWAGVLLIFMVAAHALGFYTLPLVIGWDLVTLRQVTPVPRLLLGYYLAAFVLRAGP